MMVIEGRAVHTQVHFFPGVVHAVDILAGTAEYVYEIDNVPVDAIIADPPNFANISGALFTIIPPTGAGVNFTPILTGTPTTGQVLLTFLPATETEGPRIQINFLLSDILASYDGGTFRLGGYQLDLAFAGDETIIYPADRCTWNVRTRSGGGYQIVTAHFWDGVTSTGVGIPFGRLGYIGKSGRFVSIAE